MNLKKYDPEEGIMLINGSDGEFIASIFLIILIISLPISLWGFWDFIIGNESNMT